MVSDSSMVVQTYHSSSRGIDKRILSSGQPVINSEFSKPNSESKEKKKVKNKNRKLSE